MKKEMNKLDLDLTNNTNNSIDSNNSPNYVVNNSLQNTFVQKSNKQNILTMTIAARIALKNLLTINNAANLRLSIRPGGCSGFKYNLEFTSNPAPFDEIISIIDENYENNITMSPNILYNGFLFIDCKAVFRLMGTEMDYEEDDFQSNFIFNNPNEKSKCGCGKSFGA